MYSIYDLLGLMMPITIQFKLLLQRMLSPVCGWDEELSNKLSEDSWKVLTKMIKARDIIFSRSIVPDDSCGRLQIVGWFNGGDPATGCALYLLY